MVESREWKEFRVGDFFDIKNGKGITKEEIHMHPGSLPAIQSGEERNGIIGYIDESYCVQKKYSISNGECLTVARSGSSGFIAYQRDKCVVGDSAKILTPLFLHNRYTLLFLRAVLMVNKKKYAYNDKVTRQGYLNDVIKLPVASDGQPGWAYMEQYIKERETQVSQFLDILTPPLFN